jgi:hypothetical protein
VPIYFFQAIIEYINSNCKAHTNIDVYILLVHKQPYICVDTYEIELSLPKCVCVYIVTCNYVSTLYKEGSVCVVDPRLDLYVYTLIMFLMQVYSSVERQAQHRPDRLNKPWTGSVGSIGKSLGQREDIPCWSIFGS